MIGIIGIAVGIVATFYVSRYFFFRSLEKKLSIYILNMSQVFSGVDDKIRDDLEITYKGVSTPEIHELDIVVANEGDRSVLDIIEPFTMEIDSSPEILDAQIIYKKPEERDIKLSKIILPDGKQNIVFDFPLLNKGEFFVFKVLFKNQIVLNRIKFKITSEDLPPVLKHKMFPFELTYYRSYNFAQMAAGFSILIFCISVSIVIYNAYTFNGDYSSISVDLFAEYPIDMIAMLFGSIGSVALLIISLFILADSMPNFRGRQGPQLPPHISKHDSFKIFVESIETAPQEAVPSFEVKEVKKAKSGDI